MAHQTTDRAISVLGNVVTIKLSKNATNLTMLVLIVDDDVEETGETVVLTLLESSGYVPAAPNTRMTLTIHNDDPTRRRTERRALARVRGEDPTVGPHPLTQSDAQELADGHSGRGTAPTPRPLSPVRKRRPRPTRTCSNTPPG